MAHFVRHPDPSERAERQLVTAADVTVGNVIQWQDAPHLGSTYFGEVVGVRHKGQHAIIDVVRADRFYFTGTLVKQRFSLSLDTVVTLRPDVKVEPGPATSVPVTSVYLRGSRLIRRGSAVKHFDFSDT